MSHTNGKAAPAGQGISVTSLGCKVNQAEAAYLRQKLGAMAGSLGGEGGEREVQVLFTCAVTASASRQSRQMARRLRRQSPNCRIIVTGCDLQASPQAYQDEGCLLLGRRRLTRLPAIIAGGCRLDDAEPGPPDGGPLCPGIEFPGPRRTRGLLKVQDGCDSGCAYCIVPSTRGGPRSVPLSLVVEAFAALGDAGAGEVVLTGIHLGRYGCENGDGNDLAALISACLQAHPLPHIRLSSLESAEVTPDLVELLRREPRLCPHLHIPLQSGSDRVLRAMGRPYSAQEFADTIRRLTGALPGLCLGADLLLGLPGEDEQAFQETLYLVKELPLSYFHVFPYSPRPGTRAAKMPGRPPANLAKERAALLRGLGTAKQAEFYAFQKGRQLTALAESSGLARTNNYCLVHLERHYPPGTRLGMRVEAVENFTDGPRLIGRTEPL